MANSESSLQSTCFKWFRLQYPHYYFLFFAIPNGGSRNLLEAYNLKLQGVTSGVSDTFLAVPNNHFAGLFIEFKVGHNKLTNNQTAFLKAVTAQKYATATIYDFDSFCLLISRYLNNDE